MYIRSEYVQSPELLQCHQFELVCMLVSQEGGQRYVVENIYKNKVN